jgi:hypothetical protein
LTKIAEGCEGRPRNYVGPKIPRGAYEALKDVECNICHRLCGEHTCQELDDCMARLEAERLKQQERWPMLRVECPMCHRQDGEHTKQEFSNCMDQLGWRKHQPPGGCD